ncbi:MAG: AtpZ/AtpI family protein [Haliscomenobacter sp.]
MPPPMPKRAAPDNPGQRGPGGRMKDIATYSGMAFQIGFIILLGTLAGKKLDSSLHTVKPVFTLLCSLGSVFAALYLALKDFIGKKTPRP